VGMPTTAGAAPLPATTAELAMAGRYFPARTELTGDRATVAAVVAGLSGHSWVHFACHASQDLTDPSRAAVHLYDGPLTVVEIAARQLDNPAVAFLSACQTATGGAQVLDESIHLSAALQLAGYQHVIGTLWSIPDRHSARVADAFYLAVANEAGRPDAAR